MTSSVSTKDPERRMAEETGGDDRSAEPGSFAELWRVAVPLVLSSGSLSLMTVMDRVFLSWYSTESLAASMPAGMLYWTVLSALLGTAMYVNTFVAQYEGSGRKDRVAASLWQGIYLAFVGGVCLMGVIPFSRQLFALIGHAPEVQPLEARYFTTLCYGTVPYLLSTAMSCFYSGRGKTQVVMWVNFAVLFVDGTLNWCLVFGKGPFPELGIHGAALATIIGEGCGMLLYAFLLSREPRLSGYPVWTSRGYDRELFGRLLRYGLPSGLHFLADIAGFTTFIMLVGLIGKNELAATSIAFSLNALAFIPMMGIGTAVMTLVGMRIGERRPDLAVRTTWIAYGAALVYTLLWVVLYMFGPQLILEPYALFTKEDFEPTRELVVFLLRFISLYAVFDATAIVFGSAIRGAGDTRFPLVYSFLSGWLLMVLPTYLAWRYAGGSLVISWSACAVYIVVVGIGLLLRFLGGAWKSMRVIEPDLCGTSA